jgi:hypothetical protein
MTEQSDETKLALIKETLSRIERENEEFEAKLERRFDEYVMKVVFENLKERLDDRIKPLERLIYGMVGLVLISVLTAVVTTVVSR